MVSSDPPLARLGNSTHLLDVGIPLLQDPMPGPVVETATGPLVASSRTLVTPDMLLVVREFALDDINNICTIRNEKRAEKWRFEENVSVDETIMDMEDYMAMAEGSRRTTGLRQDLPSLVVMTVPPTTTWVPLTPQKYVFTDEDACKNVQAPYILMSMFLVKNMELIQLDQGVKTHKGLGIRVVEAANFCDEKSLNFTLSVFPGLPQFPQMYGNVHATQFPAPMSMGYPFPWCITGPLIHGGMEDFPLHGHKNMPAAHQ